MRFENSVQNKPSSITKRILSCLYKKFHSGIVICIEEKKYVLLTTFKKSVDDVDVSIFIRWHRQVYRKFQGQLISTLELLHIAAK